MNEFQYDVMQKKRIARGAYAKKNGSKSKKCTLPSDYLTPAQIKKLSKDVVSVNIKKPIEYNKFKLMSPNIQREYLNNLREQYGAGMVHISEMMGCTQVTLRACLKKSGITDIPFGRGKRMTAAQKELWDAFCRGEVTVKTEPEPVAEQADVTEPQPEQEPVVEAAKPEETVKTSPKMFLSKVNLEYNGMINLASILADLKFVIGDRDCASLSISAEVAQERVTGFC